MHKSVTALVSIGALMSLATVSSALANHSALYGVKNINVSLSGGVPEITVRNVSGSHQLKDLQLAVQENTVSVGVSGYVDCTGTQFENWQTRKGHFLSGGAFGIGHGSLLMSKALPDSSSIDNVSKMDANTFQMPIAMLGNPQINVDPVAVILAAANQAPSKIAFLRQDQMVTVKIPLRWESTCTAYDRNKVTKNTIIESADTSYLTKDVSFRIKYQGDPKLFEVNAQISQGVSGGGIQAGEQNFIKINSATFIEGAPSVTSECPGTAEFKVRVNGTGNGFVRLRFNDSGQFGTVHTSPALELKDGKIEYAFSYQFGHNPLHSMINKPVAHDLRVYYTAKTKNEPYFPAHYQSLNASMAWTHTCIKPVKLNVGVGGGGGVLAPSNGGNQSMPSGAVIKPATQPIGGIQATPAPSRAPSARAGSPAPAEATGERLSVPTVPTEPEIRRVR
jgi:hypothetical protein